MKGPIRDLVADVTAHATGPRARTSDATASRNRILVVDDEPPVRRMFQRLLEFAKFDVVIAGSGAEGLQMLRDDPSIGLVLLDLMMPGMDGWRFRHAQREDARLAAIPTIVVTGSDTPQAVRDELQASDYLSKPVPFARLVSAVSAFCQAREE